MPEGDITLLDGADPLAPKLALLHTVEWGHLYENWDSTKALEEFRGQKTDGSLPATLVLREKGEMVGSVSLVNGDCEARPDLDPWLASLYVVPSFRGRGHAQLLIEAAIHHAAAARAGSLHVFTESAAGLFRRHGFCEIDRAVLHGTPVEILRRDLT